MPADPDDPTSHARTRKIFVIWNVGPFVKVSAKDIAEADIVVCSYRLPSPIAVGYGTSLNTP